MVEAMARAAAAMETAAVAMGMEVAAMVMVVAVMGTEVGARATVEEGMVMELSWAAKIALPAWLT